MELVSRFSLADLLGLDGVMVGVDGGADGVGVDDVVVVVVVVVVVDVTAGSGPDSDWDGVSGWA